MSWCTALIKPDFPKVPDWINEGLGSLYEQCSIEGDDILGHPNWRLEGLQRAIRRDKLRSLAAMIDDPRFYGEENVGLNYAQARYLLLYLQHREKLGEFYKRARDNHDRDPSGLITLKQTLNPQGLGDFEREWRQWVMGLRFP